MACRIVVVLASIVIGLQLWVSQHLQCRHLYRVLGEVGQFDHLQWTQTCALHDEDPLNFVESSETTADFGSACHPDVDLIVGLHLAALEVPVPTSLSMPSLNVIPKNYDAGGVVTRLVPSYRCSMDPAQWPELDGECLYAVLYWIHTLRLPTPLGCRRMRAEIRTALTQRPALSDRLRSRNRCHHHATVTPSSILDGEVYQRFEYLHKSMHTLSVLLTSMAGPSWQQLRWIHSRRHIESSTYQATMSMLAS